jgi:hypothetical protein
MKIEENLQLFWDDIRFKNGLFGLIVGSIFLIMITAFVAGTTFFIITSNIDFLGLSAGIGLVFFMISSYGQNRKIQELENTIKEQKNSHRGTDRRFSVDRKVSVKNIDAQMKEMNEEDR